MSSCETDLGFVQVRRLLYESIRVRWTPQPTNSLFSVLQYCIDPSISDSSWRYSVLDHTITYVRGQARPVSMAEIFATCQMADSESTQG